MATEFFLKKTADMLSTLVESLLATRTKRKSEIDEIEKTFVSVKPSATSGGRHRCQKVGAYDIHI